MFRLTVLALAALPGIVLAEGRGDALATLLAQVPQAVALPGDAVAEVYFSDLTAAAALLEPVSADLQPWMQGVLGRYDRAGTGDFGRALVMGEADWPRLVGFAPQELRQLAESGLPPGHLRLLALEPDALPDLGAALESAGYVADTRAGRPVWARGEDDYGIDFAGRNPGDPFGGTLGQSSRVALDGGLVFQASGWPELDAALGEYPVLADLADVQALIQALDAPELGPGVLVRAVVFGRSMPLAITNLPLTPEMTAEDLQALLDATGAASGDAVVRQAGAVLPLGAALVADIATPGGPGVAVLALTFPERDLAVAAADHMGRAWGTVPSLILRQTFANALGPAQTTVTGKGPFVALLIPGDPGTVSDGLLRNRSFDLLYEALLNRDLVFLPRP